MVPGTPIAPSVTEGAIAAAIVGEYYFTALEGVAGAQAIARAAKLAVGLSEADAGAVLQPVIVKAMPSLAYVTLCVLVLANGYRVVGVSVPAAHQNFDADKGKKYARENAVAQVWPLMGYALRERLHLEAPDRSPIWPRVAAAVVVDNDAEVLERGGIVTDAVHRPNEPTEPPDPVPKPPGGP